MFSPQFGDFNGDGRLDLLSGSNCCDPGRIFLFLRNPNGTFADRREVQLKISKPDLFRTCRTPHLVDWDRDGHTDLVIGQRLAYGRWLLDISLGPLAGKTEVAVKQFELPAIPEGRVPHFGFADWDGDGSIDLLAAVLRKEQGAIYWFRNTAIKGEPKFAAASPLLTVPAPWRLGAFSIVDWDQDGRLDLVVNMTKNRPGEFLPAVSQLWLYRRKA
jgi:FG-GAP-like repeat